MPDADQTHHSVCSCARVCVCMCVGVCAKAMNLKVAKWPNLSSSPFFSQDNCESWVGTVVGLDYWTGLLDWTTGLDYWTTGLDYWIGLLDYWTGLLDWTTGLLDWTTGLNQTATECLVWRRKGAGA